MARKYMPMVQGQIIQFARNHTGDGGQYYGHQGQMAIVVEDSPDDDSQVHIELIDPSGDQYRHSVFIYKRFFYQLQPYHPDQENEDDCL